VFNVFVASIAHHAPDPSSQPSPCGLHPAESVVGAVRGKVHSWNERMAVQGACWSAPGISHVVNELTVSG